MYQFRPFRNSDPPHLAAIWRSQAPQRAMVQPMTSALLEEYVFGKQLFDPEGLIVAAKNGTPIAFSHAGFGSNDAGDELDTLLGTTYHVLVHADHLSTEIEDELLGRSEAYLRSRGSNVQYGGGIRPLSGFYLGLYGGSELPGVLDSAAGQQAVFSRNGYRTIDRVVVLHCDLSLFRPPISRKYRDCSRRCHIETTLDAPTATWWETCTLGCFDRIAYDLVARADGELIAQARLWHMEPMSSTWGVKAAGLDWLEVSPDHRRGGVATCLVSHVLTDMRQQGVAVVEAQTMQHNEAALGLYQKLGFVEVDRGSVFRKDAPGSGD